MTRRLRTDRMLTQARHVRDTTALRDSVAEVARKLRDGDLAINGARRAMGLPPTSDPYGDTTAQQRPDDLAGALDWYDLGEPSASTEADWLPPAFGEVTFPDAFTDEQIADWQRAWDETVGNDPQPQRLIWLPSRTVVRSERPRKSTPRGPARMRKHRRELLINALRGDGSYRSEVQVQILKAYRVLPDEIGLDHRDRVNEQIIADLAADYGLHAAHLSHTMYADGLLPEGLEFRLEAPEPGYTESILAAGASTAEQLWDALGMDEPLPPIEPESEFMRLWRAAQTPDAHYWLKTDRPRYSPLVEAFLDHELIEPAAKGALPPRFRRPSRRALVQFAVFAALGLIPLLAALLAH
jgi:hypothetical protein